MPDLPSSPDPRETALRAAREKRDAAFREACTDRMCHFGQQDRRAIEAEYADELARIDRDHPEETR